jgi:HTH domain
MAHPLLHAIRPLADAIGAQVVAPPRLRDGDIELEWDGEVVGGVRLTVDVHDVAWYVGQVERELGTRLDELDRVSKQGAVKQLNEMGAFQLRHSVEQVAELLGVSRFTVYNYLNRTDDIDETPPRRR